MRLATIVFVAGLLLGALILLAVLRVYMEKKAFTVGDASFAALGVLLMGLSVFTTVSVTVSPTELKAQFDTVRKQVNQVANQSAVLSDGLANMGEKLNQGETTVAELTDALQRSRAVPPEAAERIRSSARTTPQIDVQRYRSLSRELRRVPTMGEEPATPAGE